MRRDPQVRPTALAALSRAWPLLALAWVSLVRVPLVLNARAHLDSDLAVDGLTLLDAVNGHWRWHYPGTPFIGSPPVLLSWPQAMAWGVNPLTLVSGGVVAYGLVVLMTYLLNRRAFGPSVASWGLIPMAFASTGTIWLSGRVTGGHLLTAAWHAGTFALLWDALTKGGWRRSAVLGLWCGLGLYLDSMFAVTWSGLGVAVCVSASLSLWERAGVKGAVGLVGSREGDPVAAGVATPLTPGPSPRGRGEEDGEHPPSKGNRIVRGFACLLAFGLASGVGVAPRIVGARLDPHDSYRGQIEPDTRPDHIRHNARIMVLDCLPRLIAGHRLPGLQAEPRPSAFKGGSRETTVEGMPWFALTSNLSARSPRASSTTGEGIPWFALTLTVFSLYLFARAMVALFIGGGRALTPGPSPGGRGEADSPTIASARVAIRWGLLASSLAVAAGFLVNRTIANSDNYRYLVFLLVPWSSGFGLMMARMASKRASGLWASGAVALAFSGLMTVDSARWYARFGWVDGAGRPVRKGIEDPALAWLGAHPEVPAIFGDYWDVYRLSFLTGGRVRGVPFPEYPDRFPEIKRNLPGGRPRVVIVGPDGFGPRYRARAMARGGREIGRAEGLSIVDWPVGISP